MAMPWSPENSLGQAPTLDQLQSSIKRLTETGLVSQNKLTAALAEVNALVVGADATLSVDDIQNRLNRLPTIEAQVDAPFLTVVPQSMIDQLNFQRPEVKKVISLVREYLQSLIKAKQSEVAQASLQRQAEVSLPLSEKIKTGKALPETIQGQLDRLKDSKEKAQQAIEELPERTYFLQAPKLDTDIQTLLSQKDTLIQTLELARRDQRTSVRVEEVIAYDEETQKIRFTFNERAEVKAALDVLGLLFQKWKESLAYQQTITVIGEALKLSDLDAVALDEVTKALIALDGAEKRLQQDPELQNLPQHFATVIHSEYGEKIATRRQEFLDAWFKKAERMEFPLPAGATCTLRNSLDTYPKTHDYSGVGQADLDDLTARIGVLQGVPTTFEVPPHAPWNEKQKEQWESKVADLRESQGKMRPVLESRNEREGKVQTFKDLLRSTEKNPPKKMQAQDDEVRQLLESLSVKMRELRGILSEREYSGLEKEFLLFKFRYIKRVIINQIHSDMNNGSNHTSYVGKTHEILFENKLIDIESAVNDLRDKGETVLANEMETELKRFKAKFMALRLTFYSGSVLEPQIIGSKDSKAGAQRQIPQQAPDWFPSLEDLQYIFTEGTETAINPDLWYDGERPFNEPASPRTYRIPDFDNPDNTDGIEEDYKANLRGDCKRILDMIAKNTLKDRLLGKIKERSIRLSDEDKKIVDTLKTDDLFRSVHIEEYNVRILPKVIEFAARILYNEEISQTFAREVWYDYIQFLHFSFLAPGSPSSDDQIYKTGQPVKYIAEGKAAGTTGASVTLLGSLVGVYQDAYAAQGGTAFFLDRFVVTGELSKPRNLPERIGMGLSGVVVEEDGESRNREKVLKALEEEGLLEEFGFLADLPFMVSHTTVWKTVPFVPSPLGFMLFKDEHGKRYSYEDNNGEFKIRRWGGNSDEEGVIPRPITGNDYVTPITYRDENGKEKIDYDILYEKIPFDKALEATAPSKWYNNGKNIESIRKILYNPSSDDIFDPDKVAALQNDAKYIAMLLPDETGRNVSAGTYDAPSVFKRMTIVSVFARCLDLLTDTDLTLAKAEEKMIRLMRVLGEDKKKDARAIDAIILCLKQVICSEEESQRSAQILLDQVSKRLEFK